MALHICTKLLLAMVVTASLTVVTASSPEDNEKRATTEESSHESDEAPIHQNHYSKSSTSKNSEIVKPGKKTLHRLIGGHIKLHIKSANEKHENDRTAWDDGLLMSSAGNGKEKKNNRNDDDDDEKKTLSQQVKEGKYGLIQNEIYPEPPKRPGIISYLGNPEVPKDTIRNLGGLDEEDIWLAENHVLVLRGGKFPDHGSSESSGRQKWPPIDDYEAPARQVKIPQQPKVPPPFPVQLSEGGSIQIIRINRSSSDDNETDDYDANPYSAKGFLPGEEPFFSFPFNGTFPELGLPGDDAEGNGTKFPYSGFPSPNGALGPFYPAIPPGAVFLPPPNNQTDYDEEDQSIYYPPPYSFYYQQDNTTVVPPGPLVPGIILPPPPNFFSLLDEKKATTKGKYDKKPSSTTSLPRVNPTYLPPRKFITKQYKTRTTTTTTTTTTPKPPTITIAPRTPIYSTNSPRIKTFARKNCKNATMTSTTKLPQRPTSTMRYVEYTTERSEEPTTLISLEYYSEQAERGNHLTDTSTPGNGRWSPTINSTPVPILAYYATTPSVLDEPKHTAPAPNKGGTSTERPPHLPHEPSYYLYPVTSGEIRATTAKIPKYRESTTESPYYKVEPIPQQQPKKQYYSVEMIPSQQTAKDYNIKFINALAGPQSTYRYTDSEPVTNPINYEINQPRVQGQRMLADPAQVYYQQILVQPPATPKPFYTPSKQQYYREDPQQQQYDYRQEPSSGSRPLYQYSYEAADYEKQRQQQSYQQQTEQQGAVSYDYQELPNGNDQYYDSGSEPNSEEERKPQILTYRTQLPALYPSSTLRPVVQVTPNPQHAYYTKQDEQLLDDVTKQYFTIFGKKLPENGVPSTTPLYRTVSSTTENPNNFNSYVPSHYDVNQLPTYKAPKVKVHYGDQTQKPYSLQDDTLVNYNNPLPPIDPDSEFIDVTKLGAKPQAQQYRIKQVTRHGVQPDAQAQQYETQRIVEEANIPPGNFVHLSNAQEKNRESYSGRPISLEGDTAVNYRNPRPTINPDAEFIDPIQGQIDNPNRAGSYFAYQLPGNGGHFYFLTPQAVVSQRQDAAGGYLYPKPRGPRLSRRKRGRAVG